MKRLCAFAALVLLSSSAHAGTIFSFEIQGRVVHINAPSGCTSLACISVSSPEFHGSNYRRGSRTKLASKAVSARKARAPAGTPNSLSLAKAPNAEDAIAAPRTTISTANSKRAVVATEPTKARSIDMPAAPATVVGTRPSPADSDAASGPTSLTKSMPVDATSDGSASPVNVVAASSHSPSPSTVEPATRITGSVYKPVQTALSPAPAVEYYGKAKESQTAPAVEYYRKAKENQNRETSDGGRNTSLLGNWQTEGQRRAIRIEQCGLFVCGYVADSSNNEKVLIDLKPTSSSSEWIGLIVSAESGITYPSVVVLEDAKTLRVRACALGMVFCEGQIWTREDPVLAAVH